MRSLMSPTFSVLSFTVSGLLSMLMAGGAGFNYGKLPKVIAGISTDAQPTQGNQVPYVFQALPLPSDLSLVGELWNPASDPLPGAGAGPPLPVSVSVTLATPLPVAAAPNLAIGLWLQPALVSRPSGSVNPAFQFILTAGTWSIVYDDGV